MMGEVRRVTGLGEQVVVIVMMGLTFVLLAQIAPGWSETLRLVVAMGVAIVALRATHAAVDRSA
jgi:hypothetical protein